MWHQHLVIFFFLGILLNKVKGPTSYEDIRTVNGQVFNSYIDACYDLGLLDDDKEYIEGIQEAFFGEGGHFVRKLFAQLLLSNTMSRPKVIFEKTFRFLSVDIVHQHRTGTQIEIELLKDLTLQEIDKLLQRNISSLRNFITKLTSEQKEAYDQIIKAVDHGKGGVFFLYGYGGTGKTFLWKTLSSALRRKGEIVLNVASSGIAALLLSGGQTAHSHFHIPLHPTDESLCSISPSSKLGELIRRTKLFI
ncbi:uncharacterized protein [Rutidosis leptorrhynchoides]|uniref:uncharacterized protein n=1 Tax=Rutidosis leptorrhynchoides TaxID=125765 RepID=UPI003A98D1EB